jgi:hypothetical protein
MFVASWRASSMLLFREVLPLCIIIAQIPSRIGCEGDPARTSWGNFWERGEQHNSALPFLTVTSQQRGPRFRTSGVHCFYTRWFNRFTHVGERHRRTG